MGAVVPGGPRGPVALTCQVAEVSGMSKLPPLSSFKGCRLRGQGYTCRGRSHRPLASGAY